MQVVRALLLILVLAVVLTVFASFTGFVPVISHIVGADTPRDLAVTYNPDDSSRALSRLGVTIVPLPKTDTIGTSVRYTGMRETDAVLNASEVTSLIDGNSWQYQPVSRVQVRFNGDGTAEVSGILHVDRVLPYVSMTDSVDAVRQAMDRYHISGNPPFYLKGAVEVTDNHVSLRSETVEIGRVVIPGGVVEANLATIEQFVTRRIQAVPNLSIRSLTLTGGAFHLVGTVPEQEYRAE